MEPDSDLLGPNGLSNVTFLPFVFSDIFVIPTHSRDHWNYDLLSRTKEQRTYMQNSLLLYFVTFPVAVCLGGISTLQ